IQYFIRTDITRDETGLVQGIGYLKDAWVRFNFRNDFSMRIGQFKSPFMREELVDSSRQLAAERSIMNENLSIERTQGIEFLFSADPTSTLAISLNDGGTDQIGGFNLAQSDPKNTDALANIAEWAVTGRWEKLIAGRWKQFADFTSPQGDEFGMLFGIAAHAQQNRRGVPSFFPNQRDWVAYTTDLSVEWGGANLFASWTHHYLEIPNLTVNVYGALVQGGVYLTPKWELFGRFEYAWYRFDNNGLDQLAVFTIGTNYYIEGHALKWTNDLGVSFNQIDAGFMRNSMITNYRQETSSSAGPQVVFRTQLQLLF
ncbi:MAG: porin, partial [Planctomycetota bacterium]